METLVLVHAVVIAVLHILALADGLENVPGRAPLANSNAYFFTLSELESERVICLLLVLDNDEGFL